MAIQYSAAVLDASIAPSVSAFTTAEIPDGSQYSKECEHWVANFFLNSTFRARFQPPMNAYAYNFIRRAQNAFAEHRRARERTVAFLTSGRQSAPAYADALYHWECFLGQAWHAYKLLATAFEGTLFAKNDGSVEQRLNALYNQMKHVESRIENGQMIPGATVPVWLENSGLRSIDAHLTFDETGTVLADLAKYADALTDPQSAKAKLGDGSPP